MSPIIYRIIDANINRLKEGLRVIEEWCRFGLDNENYASICKKSRHEIIEICRQAEISFSDLVSSRDTEGDVGVSLSSINEYEREDVSSVLKANFNRVQESLRVLEEYSKIFKTGKPFEKIRYEMYTLEKDIFSDKKKLALQSELYVLLTESLCRLPITECVQELLDAGARLFQLREKDKSDRVFFQMASGILSLVRQYDGVVIINDNFSIAQITGADGIHLGLNDLPLTEVKDMVPKDFIIGATVHNMDELLGLPDFVDYIGVGPCFESVTKPDIKSEGLGLIKKVIDESKFRSFAIGGIGSNNINSLLSIELDQFAVCSAIIGSSTPGEEFKKLQKMIIEKR